MRASAAELSQKAGRKNLSLKTCTARCNKRSGPAFRASCEISRISNMVGNSQWIEKQPTKVAFQGRHGYYSSCFFPVSRAGRASVFFLPLVRSLFFCFLLLVLFISSSSSSFFSSPSLSCFYLSICLPIHLPVNLCIYVICLSTQFLQLMIPPLFIVVFEGSSPKVHMLF